MNRHASVTEIDPLLQINSADLNDYLGGGNGG
eukprot:CAMPEP_0118710202 /NCGR_PEP_ID=MMETSP0800-20121206/23202_1 /TAXON_ID=210618 ORGANISM="Striatella unipunctata, Strain CCMP2910" /NCGR_SAMPLE_ID=MMETSP0800 /ASSEMBLY_ACC=CAM_ASM_000638 /LENGTH=31 /DNA_ID= /DNA_START= /DNA_END= /DNA_ORIENTATION=